jgi:hypothetical protein
LTEDEGEVNLSTVPDVVIAAVEAAKPGAIITGAELETEAGVEMYEITAEQDGLEYEIDVTPEGEVLEVIVDDDSDDERMLAFGYTLVVVCPLALVLMAVFRKKLLPADDAEMPPHDAL